MFRFWIIIFISYGNGILVEQGCDCLNFFIFFTVLPNVQALNQLLGAPLGTDVILECYVEAYPNSVNYWIKNPSEMLLDRLASRFNISIEINMCIVDSQIFIFHNYTNPLQYLVYLLDYLSSICCNTFLFTNQKKKFVKSLTLLLFQYEIFHWWN